jgi:hypothetical protein
MASVTIPTTGTAGSVNVPVAVESNAAGMFQLVKLTDSNVGSLDPVGTSANPLTVKAFSISALTQSSITAFQGGAAPWSVIGSVGVTGVGGSVSALVQSSITAFQGATWTVVGSTVALGDVAHNASDAGNPVKIGGYAVSSQFPVAVDSGDRVNAFFDTYGRQVITQFAPIRMRESVQGAFTGAIDGTVVWSPAAAGRLVVTDFKISTGSATAGHVALYFAGSGPPANFPFVPGSGIAIFAGEFAPSATAKPGALMAYTYPELGPVNGALRIRILNTMQVYLSVGGYEIT